MAEAAAVLGAVDEAKPLKVDLEGLGSQLRRDDVQAIQAETVNKEELVDDVAVGGGNAREAFGENG